MFRSKSIQSKLFFNYSLIIIGIVLVFVISFYIYISNILENKASESLYQMSSHISSEFDSLLKNMNSTSKKILFSSLLKELFFSDMFELSKSTIDQQRQFKDIMFTMIGFENEFPQISMFQATGEFASLGNTYVFSKFSPGRFANVAWVQETFNLKGAKLISLPHIDDWNLTQGTVISLTRAFSQDWAMKPNSILEIQQDYSKFSDIVNNALEKPDSQISKDIKIYVFNKQGQLVYPMDKNTLGNQKGFEKTTEFYWESVNKNKNSNFIINNPITQSKDMLAYYHSDFSEWTVIAAESRNELLQPVITFRNATLILGSITVFITLLISYIVSKRLTTPIKKIYKSIKRLSLTTLSTKPSSPITSDLNELEQLNVAFQEMLWRLQESLNAAIASRAHEVEAHIFALQAQMNPHFLYNTISNVSIMAEENGQKAIVAVCDSLSIMLRYISSDHAAPVSLRLELEHTLNYLNLMKIRYEENVIFNIDVSEKLLDIDVPKLMIQPIVENFMKYGIDTDPPWVITIVGHYYPDKWELIILDNGQGFEDNEIIRLKEQFASTDPLDRVPSLKINGMGLLNIYIRLRLLFGNKMSFDLGNHPEGGAIVTIIVKY